MDVLHDLSFSWSMLAIDSFQYLSTWDTHGLHDCFIKHDSIFSRAWIIWGVPNAPVDPVEVVEMPTPPGDSNGLGSPSPEDPPAPSARQAWGPRSEGR